MPDYTRTWSDSDPPGSRAAREIDNAIRELRVDVHERMDDITQNWEADPVQIRGGGLLNNWGCSYTVVPGGSGSPFGSARIQAQLLVPILGQVNNGIFTVDLNLISQATGVNWDVSNLYYPPVPSPEFLVSFPFSGVIDSNPSRGSIHLEQIERAIDQNLLSFITKLYNGNIYTDQIRATVTLPFLRVS